MSSTEILARSELTAVREALSDTYDVIDVIGRGGMAVVYRARDRALGREVAIKVLPLTSLTDHELVARFEREARTSGRLEHPNIVPIFEVGRRDTVIYFVMKLLRGQSLAARLKQEGTLSARDVRKVLIETASALGHAARLGIVHRDIKPDNILLDDEGRCVVTDFGIARSMSDVRLTSTGMSVGTPRYMSPEQARAKDVDGRSDIYSLGVLAYECLIGRTPFDGDDVFAILLAHIQSPLPRPRLASREERALYAIIERMLAKRPEDRYQSADELIIALQSPANAHVATPPDLDITQPQLSPVVRPAGDDDSGPRPSPVLDAAVRAGIELLQQHRPKVEAGLVAGRELLEANMPRARRELTRATRATVRIVAIGARHSATFGSRLVAFFRARGRRFWLGTTASIGVLFGSYYAVHFATMHRSRCPSASATHAFDVRADDIGTVHAGSDLEVYYDVCGLADHTAFSTRIAVVKQESRFRWLLGSTVSPVTLTFDESASGPAERRHRTVGFGEMPPGAYTLAVIVTDAERRRRTREVPFQVVAR